MINKPIKHSVALRIHSSHEPSKVLLVRRPEDDAEFPGAWGLPAASCRPGETLEEAAQRIGRQKLGVGLKLKGSLCHGQQDRPGYIIEMTLLKAELDAPAPQLPSALETDEGVTLYTGWRWGKPSEVEASAQRGSLCSQLLLKSAGRAD